MAYQRKDHYFKKAKEDNYAARSIYKLEEIDQRYRLLKQGQKVLDLGAAPGSWSQYTSTRIGPQGRLLAIDLQPIRLTLPNAHFEVADLLTVNFEELFARYEMGSGIDVVLSDMAPRTTGIRITDQARSLELSEMALAIAARTLKKSGSFVCKLFHGAEFEAYRKQLQSSFEKVSILRPKSTRKESKEIFFIAQGFKA